MHNLTKVSIDYSVSLRNAMIDIEPEPVALIANSPIYAKTGENAGIYIFHDNLDPKKVHGANPNEYVFVGYFMED